MMIRPYQKKDFRYVQDICMAAWMFSESVEDNPLNRTHHCALYCDYYLDNQPEFCFVAVDDDDIPVGYILCSADCDDYYIQMDNLYLPLVRKLDSGERFKFNAMHKLKQQYIRQGYTAHLHLNMLDEYLSQELGAQLIETLCAKLKELNVEGVHLICNKKDVFAKALYEHCGFEDIDYISGAIVYGQKFFEE